MSETAKTGEMGRADALARAMSELKNQELPLLDVQGAVIPKDLSREYLQAPENSRTLGLIERIAVRERQLSAALNELKAKDTELAAKDARIAELEADAKAWKRAAGDCAEQQLAVSEGSLHAQQGKPMDPSYSVSGKLNYSYQAAYEDVQNRMATESRLGAVSEVLKEKPEPHPGNMYRDACYYPDEIDPLFARLRSIVEGK